MDTSVIFAVLAALQAADVATTLKGLKQGAVEGNFLLGKNPSKAKLIGLKVLYLTALGLFLLPGREASSSELVCGAAVAALYAFVVAHNLKVIRGKKNGR